MSRRAFLRTSGALALGAAGGGIGSLLAEIAQGASATARGFGRLVADPAGVLDLPAGFRYRAFSTASLGTAVDPRWSQKLTDGDPVPAMHDGMGAFGGPGRTTILVRNHELDIGGEPMVDPGRRKPYDPLTGGGTTTLWIDGDRTMARAFPSLSGTCRNCGGGVTPWGTWITAEECVYVPGEQDPVRFDATPRVSRRHGYLFEVDARAEELVEPVPLVAMGRFMHEAVAVDPWTGHVYETEDRHDGLLYRFRPAAAEGRGRPSLGVGDLAKGGALEALRVVDRPGLSTLNWDEPRGILPGRPMPIEWVPIDSVDPDTDSERDPEDPERGALRPAAGSTRAQGFREGAARFARPEGIVYDQGSIFLCCTDGGSARLGQVWRLDLARQRLTLLVEPNAKALMDGPDNLARMPNGDLLVCEDGDDDNHLVAITSGGRFYRLARNAAGRSEFAGACFGPDGRTLFVNVQNPGITFAIWGPWGARVA